MDTQLPKLITICLALISLASLCAASVLRIYGFESNDIAAIAIGSSGALAGFLARGSVTKDQ